LGLIIPRASFHDGKQIILSATIRWTSSSWLHIQIISFYASCCKLNYLFWN
jgi:hypothetical protein